jgi:predicted GNAT family N-acyltransferase
MSRTIIITDWRTHKTELSNIRTRVFIEEQAVPEADEWDEYDSDAIHFLVQESNVNAIGCARLLTESNPQGGYLYHIGRVAVLREFRAQGIGHQLMLFIINYCLSTEPDRKIYLHAQTTRRSFYEQLGFCARGSEFMDAGIPHISMWFEAGELQNG